MPSGKAINKTDLIPDTEIIFKPPCSFCFLPPGKAINKMELLLCETRVKIDSWYKDYSQASLLIHFPALRPGLGIRSFAHRLFAHLLRSLKSNEQLWAIRSGQRSNCEPIAQVTHEKWATVSDSLRSLMLNEQNSKKSKIKFFGTFFVCLKKQVIAHSLFFNEWCERIAQAAHQKWATMSDSLRSNTKNERPWAIRSGRSPKIS